MFKLVILLLVLVEFVELTQVTYYEILGVTKQSSASEIRQAYKKLAIKYHPDKNSDKENQEKFLKITEAYETLKDPDKRRKYDLYGIYPSYTRKYDYNSQSEYNNLYYNGLYHNDPFVDTLNGASFVNYLQEGFYFINFYSPFCPPCQNLVDHWKKLAETYKGIVKIGAVNCKYHNSFCYNSMRIGSYPSLLFYPNGKHGNFIYYRDDRTLEALDNFVMTYLSKHIYVPVLAKLRGTNNAMGYVLGANRVDKEVLTRIAYRLNNLVTIAIVEDDKLRDELTNDDYTVVVFKYKDIIKEIKSTEEKDILREIVEALPDVEQIDPDKLKDIRNRLRNGYETAWVLYFSSSKDEDRLLLYQIKTTFPDMHFGEIDCDKWSQLCLSLQTEETPAWAVLKQGGGYQRASANADVRAFLRVAPTALCLHTLSTSELQRILNGEFGAWVLLVAPHQTSWEDMEDAFTQTSLRFIDSDDLHFGIMSCTENTDKYCHLVTTDDPVILVQNGTKRHTFNGQVNEQRLLEFIDLVRDNYAVVLTEDHVLQILGALEREHSWLVAHLPAHCGTLCDELAHQIQLVAKKLRPLDFMRVGIHQCAEAEGFCANVRIPTARLYPFASRHHYTSNLQHLAQAPYILEWVLEIIDDSTDKLNWHKFSRNVISEELNPTSDKKPWLIYFHSPRCYRCYEMYADFAITGILLNNAVQIGKVDCLTERNLCQHEQITRYPSIKLYLSRNKRHQFSSVIPITVKEYSELLDDIRPHLRKYDENLLGGLGNLGMGKQGAHIKHDEF